MHRKNLQVSIEISKKCHFEHLNIIKLVKFKIQIIFSLLIDV